MWSLSNDSETNLFDQPFVSVYLITKYWKYLYFSLSNAQQMFIFAEYKKNGKDGMKTANFIQYFVYYLVKIKTNGIFIGLWL